MLVKEITYRNLDDEEVKKTFHFQITKAEVLERAIVNGGDKYLEGLSNLTVERDGKKIMETFKEVLFDAVGQREGQLFIKNDDIRKQFQFSGAWDQFFLDLLGEPDSGAKAIAAIMPADAQDAIKEALARREAAEQAGEVLPNSGTVNQHSTGEYQLTGTEAREQTVATAAEQEPAWLREGRYATPKELMSAGAEETRLAMKMKAQKAFG
jgi:hypothetical protein